MQHAIDAASAVRNAAQHDESRTVLDMNLNVAEAYITVLRAQRDLEVAQSSVIRLRSFAADAQNLYGEGIVPKNDQLAADVALADARQHEIQANNRLDIARGAYDRSTRNGRSERDHGMAEGIRRPTIVPRSGGRSGNWITTGTRLARKTERDSQMEADHGRSRAAARIGGA